MPARACPPVPRLLFEDWTREDFRRVWDSEDEIEELSKAVVQVAKVRLGAPRGQHRLPPDHGSPGLGAFPWVMSSCAWPGCRGGGSEGHRSGQHTQGSPGLSASGFRGDPRTTPQRGARVPAAPSSPARPSQDQHFDGFVVEVWSQLLSQKHM